MDPNPTEILSKKATFKGVEGSSKEATCTKEKKQVVKPKAVEEELSQKDVSKNCS